MPKFYKAKDGEFFYKIEQIGAVTKITKVTNHSWIYGVEQTIRQSDQMDYDEVNEINEDDFISNLACVHLKIFTFKN